MSIANFYSIYSKCPRVGTVSLDDTFQSNVF